MVYSFEFQNWELMWFCIRASKRNTKLPRDGFYSCSIFSLLVVDWRIEFNSFPQMGILFFFYRLAIISCFQLLPSVNIFFLLYAEERRIETVLPVACVWDWNTNNEIITIQINFKEGKKKENIISEN